MIVKILSNGRIGFRKALNLKNLTLMSICLGALACSAPQPDSGAKKGPENSSPRQAVLQESDGATTHGKTSESPAANVQTVDLNKIVARSGELTTSAGELREDLEYYHQHGARFLMADELETDTARVLVESIIAAKAEAAAADAAGVGQDPTFKQLESAFKGVMVAEETLGRLMKSAAGESTDSLLAEAHKLVNENPDLQSHEQKLVFHYIFLKTANLDEAGVAKQRKKAEETLARLKAGEDFVTVMKEVSEARDKSGKPVSVTNATPGFDPKLFGRLSSLKAGEVSDVIANKAGLNIFKVESIGPATSFAASLEEIKADPMQVNRLVNLVKFGKGRRPLMMARLRAELQAPAPPTDAELAEAMAKDDAVIYQFGGQTLTTAQVKQFEKLQGAPGQDGAAAADADAKKFAESARRLADGMVLSEKARREGWDNEINNGAAVRFLERSLHRRFLRDRALASIAAPTDEQLNEFIKNSPGIFTTSTVVLSGCELTLQPRPDLVKEMAPLLVLEEINKLRDELQKGKDVDELVNNFKNDRFQLEKKCWEKKASQQIQLEGGRFAERLVRENDQKVGEPERLDAGYSIFYVRERTTGVVPPLEAMRGVVEQQWRGTEEHKRAQQARTEALAKLELEPDWLTVTQQLNNQLRAEKSASQGPL